MKQCDNDVHDHLPGLIAAAAAASWQVTMTLEELTAAREILRFQISAKGLRNKETIGKSDPFLEISRMQVIFASRAGLKWILI